MRDGAMSRRDTIIIAVLVNAGLLMLLFATAMRSKDDTQLDPPHVLQLAESSTQTIEKQPILLPKEEIDHVLNQYATAPTFVETKNDELIAIENHPAMPVVAAPIANNAPQVQTQSLAPSIQSSASSTSQLKNSGTVLVTVKKGDYLDKIARNNGTTVNEIVKVNQLDSTQLKIGQVLKVPVQSTTTVTREENKATENKTVSNEPEYYIVKSGDNPWLIASKNQVKLDDLLRLNNLDDQKAKRLKAGDKLRIR